MCAPHLLALSFAQIKTVQTWRRGPVHATENPQPTPALSWPGGHGPHHADASTSFLHQYDHNLKRLGNQVSSTHVAETEYRQNLAEQGVPEFCCSVGLFYQPSRPTNPGNSSIPRLNPSSTNLRTTFSDQASNLTSGKRQVGT